MTSSLSLSVNKPLSSFEKISDDALRAILFPLVDSNTLNSLASVSRKFNNLHHKVSNDAVDTLKKKHWIQLLCPNEDSMNEINRKLSDTLRILPGFQSFILPHGQEALNSINRQYHGKTLYSVQRIQNITDATVARIYVAVGPSYIKPTRFQWLLSIPAFMMLAINDKAYCIVQATDSMSLFRLHVSISTFLKTTLLPQAVREATEPAGSTAREAVARLEEIYDEDFLSLKNRLWPS